MPIDPITGALVGGSVIANFLQGGAAARQARENLAWQKQQFNESMRFGKAARTDAYGNIVKFDDALNQWLTELTPQQQRNVKAGEHEQFLGLTEDAGRNRNIRRRAEQRGLGAGEDYNRELAGYRFDKPQSEGSIYDELTSLITRARDTGGRTASTLANRQGVRQRGNMPIVNVGGGGDPGADLAKTMLQARGAALGEKTARDQGHNSKYLPALEHFRTTMDMGGGAPVQMSTTPQSTGATQDAMAQLIASIQGRGAANVNTASGASVTATGKQFPSLGDTARLIAALRGGRGAAKLTGEGGGPRDELGGWQAWPENEGYFGGSPENNPLLTPYGGTF